MEFPLAQIGPQGSHKTTTPTFTTFQPVDLPRKSCQGLGLLPELRPQTLKAEEAQFSPRALDAHAAVSGNLRVQPLRLLPSLPWVSPQALGAASSQEDTGKAEEVPREGGQSLQAETRAWFQKTQAHGLLQHGAAPPWFHGFITRREAERLLETKPQGCYLVRFSESAVTFVLTYRSRTCCRHFLLAQLGDGRHVVLGEDTAHARLQDLLRYYSGSPLSPYGETLSQPLARQTPEPAGLSLKTEESDSGSKSQDPHLQYSPILKKEKPGAPTQKEGGSEPKEPPQPPRPKPPVPAKPQLPPEVYTSPDPRPCPALPSKPSKTSKPSNPIYHEPEEPIAFYAMGRGSPGEAPSNIYAEVEMGVPPRAEGSRCIFWYSVLQKCQARPVPGSQVWDPHKEAWRSEDQMWNPLPFRNTPTGSLPDSSAFGASVRMWTSRALLPPTALASPRGVRFLGPLSLWVWALVQCCCCLRVGLARTDVRTCLLILVWLINHHQPPPPAGIQVLQAPSVSDALSCGRAGGWLNRHCSGRERGLGVERHQDKGHRPFSAVFLP